MPEKKEKAPETIKWKKPSGKSVTTNAEPETVLAAEALGWKRIDKK